MKRRTFILTATAASAVAITGLVFYNRFSGGKSHDPVITPEMLSRFCDVKTILEIGNSYRKQTPEENTKEKLTNLLLTDSTGKQIKTSDKSEIAGLIERKIRNDFFLYRIIVLKGWIISITEARQCALFSLTLNFK